MNVERFVEWLRRQGYRLVSTESSYWFEARPRLYQAIPYHETIQPNDAELERLLRDNRAIALRYSAPFKSQRGMASYHVIFNETDYMLGALPKKARYDVRKGLKHAKIEPVSFSRLATEGWLARRETLERQGRAGAEGQFWWQNLCTSSEGLPGFEAWGAISDGELVASLIAFTCNGWCDILYQQSKSAHLANGVNNALLFVFASTTLDRPGTEGIFYGLHSLDAPPSVDRFKLRMRFEAKPVRQRVVFHPRMEPLLNPASHAALAQVSRLLTGNSTIAKAEGMVRFYLEGKKPILEQQWPPPLERRRAELEAMLD